jgi:hypothetical protein
MHSSNLGVRWTLGDVSTRGFEALRLSVWGAWKLFGPEARYTICVNTVPLCRARDLTGHLPEGIHWRVVTRNDFPRFLSRHIDSKMAEGVAWKLSPLQVYPDRYELALDNDCVLWDVPEALRLWLDRKHSSHGLIAEDVVRCPGQFNALCGPGARNGGIRGLPPDFDYAAALQAVLKTHPVVMMSELDEQGLQTAALERALPLLVVSTEDVSICSPFPPHQSELGRCGAHFVGQNAHALPWSSAGRPAVEHLGEHWARHRETVAARVQAIGGAKRPISSASAIT